jgi:hypothetical protein
LSYGHQVVPIHPNAVKACRPRYSATGRKHDLGDAYLLADVLRTDGHRFRPLTAASDAVKALRVLVRTRDDLVKHCIALTNQLQALLDSFWPGPAAVFYQIGSPIALAFLQKSPTPGSAARLGEKRMAAFLKGEKYRGRYSAAELLARLRAAPVGSLGKLEEQASGELVLALTRVIAPLLEQIVALAARIEAEVAQLEDGVLLMSLPYAGHLTAAKILGELGDVRERLAMLSSLPPKQASFQSPSRAANRAAWLSLGLQPSTACCRHALGGQLPPRLPLGRPDLRRCQSARLPASARCPHTCPSLGACSLESLDDSRSL